jgi:hypothetical protein
MKKIIDHKTYDTETAESIVVWQNSYGYSDFNWASESLYRTKKGRFFLHAQGGPLSMYAESFGNERYSGERLIPLTEEKAFEWLAKRDFPDIAEELMPEMVEEA